MWEKVINILGNENSKTLKSYHKVVSKINALEDETKALDDEDFPQKSADFITFEKNPIDNIRNLTINPSDVILEGKLLKRNHKIVN